MSDGPRWPGAITLPQQPFRRLFSPLARPVPEGAGIVTAFTDGQVTLRSNRSKIGYHEAADLSGYQGVRRGDFVVHGLDIMRGSVGISDSDGAISAVCIVCEPSDAIDPRYVAYAIRLQAASGYPKALARGVREGGADFRRWATLAELPIPVPPRDQQTKIADYLDRETAQIDTLIAKQERLIATLRERRFAVIAQTFEGKALGAVEWRTRTLRHWFESLDSHRVPLSAIERGDRQGPYPYYGASGVIDSVDNYLFDEDLVLVSEDGANLVLRSTPIAFAVHGKVWVNNHAHVLRPIQGDAEFWGARLNLLDLQGLVTGSAQPKLTATALMSIPIDAPESQAEQRRIAEQLQSETAKIDALIAKAEQFIALSKERRAALITAAVTGQLEIAA